MFQAFFSIKLRELFRNLFAQESVQLSLLAGDDLVDASVLQSLLELSHGGVNVLHSAGKDGIAPACGALISPIEIATGKKAYFCGKPNPLMMRTGLRMLDCHSADAVMIGDRMDTDMISGLESGMSTVLVLSGVTTKEEAAKYAYQPSMILNGVGDIVKEAKKYK